MCILFSYISKRINPNEFKLILLNNRDEYHQRPSKPVDFVNEYSLYGMDLTPGKEGGTWIGTSRLGKIAVLLNLNKDDYGFDNSSREGRGFLVPNFLHSDLDSAKYIESLKSVAKSFNPFNIVFYERNDKDLWNVSVFNNLNNELEKPNSEYVSLSNHLYDKNHYPKTIMGEKLFKNIVSKLNNTSKKEELIDSLINLAKNDAEKKFEERMTMEELKALEKEQICIQIPNYGTRTHTIILVDDKNRVTINEKTMKCPIDYSNPIWEEKKLEFSLDPLNNFE